MRRIKIRILARSCSEGRTCPMKATVDEDPAHTYFVYTPVTDPDVLAAFAEHIGVGEALGKVPNHIA